MKLYIVLEQSDVEVIGLHVFNTEFEANEKFDQICIEDLLGEIDKEEWSDFELVGSTRIAGDDSRSAQIVVRELL